MRGLFIFACVLALALAKPTPAPTPQCVDPSLTCVSDLKTPYPPGCFFSLASQSGTHWFVDPNGKAFWSKGVVNLDNKGVSWDPNGLYYNSIKSKYPNSTYWAQKQGERLECWGLNSLGPWSAPETSHIGVPYTILLSFSNGWGLMSPNAEQFASGIMPFPDIYDPGFVTYSKAVTLELCAPAINDPYLLGYYLDNEIMWEMGNGSAWKSILSIYLNYTGIPGNLKAQQFLKDKYTTISALNAAWKINATNFATINEFWPYKPNTQAMIADCYVFQLNTVDYYYNITTSAVRFQDPNHLILGVKDMGRGGQIPPNTILIPAGKWSDVYSLDYYVDLPDPLYMETLWNQTKLPVIIAEMTFRANDTGLGNHNGNGLTNVPDQQARADHWEAFIKAAASYPYIVGVHWYMWFDQPFACVDPATCKDSNLGLVNQTDDIYVTLTNRMASVFPTIDKEHGASCSTFTPKCPAKRACPGKCNGNGCCNKNTGVCMCDSNHAQLDCSGFIGSFTDTFSSIDSSRWTVADSTSAQLFYLSANRITTGSSGLTIYLNGSNCPAKCGGLNYATTQLATQQPYKTGTFKISLKTTDDANSNFQINWITPLGAYVKEGLYLTIVPNGDASSMKITAFEGGYQTFSKNYPLGYNPSTAFNNISVTRNSTNAYIIYAGPSSSPLATVPSNVAAGGVFGFGFLPLAGAPSHADSASITSVSFTAPTFSKGTCSRSDEDCDCEYEDFSGSDSGDSPLTSSTSGSVNASTDGSTGSTSQPTTGLAANAGNQMKWSLCLLLLLSFTGIL